MKKYRVIIIIIAIIYVLSVIGMELFISPEEAKAFGTPSQTENANSGVNYLVILTTILVLLSFITPVMVYKYSNFLEREDKFGIYFPFLIMAVSLFFPPAALAILFIKSSSGGEGVEEEYLTSSADNLDDSYNYMNIRSDLRAEINNIITDRKLRPLGNKKRLTQTDNEYNVRLFLFADQNDSERYYEEFLSYTDSFPPPFCIEIMHVNIHTIYDEPYGLVFPYERTDTRPEYAEWFREAILTCNEILRNFQSADHNYDKLHKYARDLYNWTILVPDPFDLNSTEANEIFSDPEGEGYTALKTN